MQCAEDAENAASLDALLASKCYVGCTVADAIARLSAYEHVQTTQARNAVFLLRLAAFEQTISDMAIDIHYLKKEATVVEGVVFTADVDALLRRPGALSSFKALADEPCVRAMFAAHRPRLTDAVFQRCLVARFITLRLPDAIAAQAANTDANARANAAAAVDTLDDFTSAELNSVLRALLEERQSDSNDFYLFHSNVFSWVSRERSRNATRDMDGKVLLVPVATKARWDLAVIVRTGRSAVDMHIFGPRRKCADKVTDKVEGLVRTLLGACEIRHVHMPLTSIKVAKEFHFAYMAVTLRAFLREHAKRKTMTYSNHGVLDVDWIHDFAPTHSYDDIMAMHAFARAHHTQAAELADVAGAIRDLSASAFSGLASVTAAEPSASKRKALLSKTTSKKAKNQ
ncbi:hypothetical protein, variant 2 [Saprolegnia diclina VS20]|uniref:Uncharacterized protein n=1 Tax=Saprolegnia diclina (strain VS20) TaxID=1156394 RepID=T0PSC3_SAPDV|nr:hypothetical protein SDRG_16971 [Saprolegnia diclina VS20]XP_008621422.1 hypothetical protein, variant 1 [Saprolegnia diclina VS20]XP_008621423.1 hypothetical protein, variant 2 [Saprolegnia diclina VS20]EQC25139.1 hypothetical protein SDRG_16971 [Saprolegnia diclina VS20]EQC25140.1 hypothetical protein, variant 1 [Saprolegnia diclina VS20]EQC25141.1 hypothetical protein, variant 2 [Saprolegnia diclina VS20]|eukprot:XP_008621421.1 hypothetical protein SDRG_16971 [Saprolegnia diclina VS20]